MTTSTTPQPQRRVAVSRLVAGQRLVGSAEMVVWAYRGVHTPKGKHSVRLKSDEGTVRDCIWNSSTQVWITDPTDH